VQLRWAGTNGGAAAIINTGKSEEETLYCLLSPWRHWSYSSCTARSIAYHQRFEVVVRAVADSGEMSDQISAWLEQLGLGKYGQVFSNNEVDVASIAK
jgi:hypothetical protein